MNLPSYEPTMTNLKQPLQKSTLENVIYNKSNYEMNSNYNREYVPSHTWSNKVQIRHTFNTTINENEQAKSIVFDKKELENVLPTRYARSRPRSTVFTPYHDVNLGFSNSATPTKVGVSRFLRREDRTSL
jgi:hypothetical protein